MRRRHKPKSQINWENVAVLTIASFGWFMVGVCAGAHYWVVSQ